MNGDKFLTLFGSPAAPQVEGDDYLETAYAEGYLKLGGVKPVGEDEAQPREREQQEALFLAAIIGSL